MMGVFGAQKLQDDIFCLTQERDFFQSRYLEQVSQIQDMKQEMEAYRKEIDRLRQELLNQSMHLSTAQDKKVEDMAFRSMTIIADVSPRSDLTDSEDLDDEEYRDKVEDTGNDEGEDNEEDSEANNIRQNAAKLLQWADYRTSVRISTPAKETKDRGEEDSATESFSASERSANSVED